MATLKSITRWTAMAGMMVVVLVALAGCDVYSSGGWGSGYYSGYDYYPSYGYYDPTSDIQDVIGYRQEVMDNTATAWDQYITGDYYGGDNDDLSTPTYWASGPEWP